MSIYGSGLYGAGIYAGSADTGTLEVRYTTDDASDPSPTWVTVADGIVRAFDTQRGRDNERSLVEAGTAQIVLSNRDRTFDPEVNPLIRPLNRWWIRVEVAGVYQDVFVGYAESYEQRWPAGGVDAIAVVSCVDEMKVLSLDALPSTDPPRGSYQELVLFDDPSAYWPLLAPNVLTAAVGDNLVSDSYASVTGSGAVSGQIDPGYLYLSSTEYVATNLLNFGDSVDLTGNGEFAIEAWISIDGGSAGETLFRGPLDNLGEITWRLALDTSEQLVLYARNSGGTTYSVTSTSVLTQGSIGPSNVWYHVVGTIDGGNLRLYVNGTQEASTAWTGVFQQIEGLGSNAFFAIGNLGADIGSATRAFDEVAFYKFGLSADRILAHYTAGTARGFARGDAPGDRIEEILDAADNLAPRSIRTGTHDMTGRYMTGQPPIEEIRAAESAENVDAVFFIARDGTVTFLDDGHRSVSPWNTVQATFDDDGTDLPYRDITLDYSESFLANEITVSRVGRTATVESDATSIAEYFKRSLALNELPILFEADQDAIAAALLAKYKDPMPRITGLTLSTAHVGVAEAAFALEIGDRIRVFRSPPGGGARIDQTLFVQSIAVSASPERPFEIRLGVSPL